MEIKIIESPIKNGNEIKEILKFIPSQGNGWDEFYQDELTKKDLFYNHWHIVMEEKEKFIGHCHICQSIKDPELAMFAFLEVDKNFRGQGIARRLYKQSMEILEGQGVKLVVLSTSFENPARKYIYLEDGFRDIFVGPGDEGRVAMVKSFSSNPEEYIRNYLSQSGEKHDLRSPECKDYIAVDLVMNQKLNQVEDKSTLPLNAWGKHGDYCLFRDHSLLINRIKVMEVGGRVVDVVIDEL